MPSNTAQWQDCSISLLNHLSICFSSVCSNSPFSSLSLSLTHRRLSLTLSLFSIFITDSSSHTPSLSLSLSHHSIIILPLFFLSLSVFQWLSVSHSSQVAPLFLPLSAFQFYPVTLLARHVNLFVSQVKSLSHNICTSLYSLSL